MVSNCNYITSTISSNPMYCGSSSAAAAHIGDVFPLQASSGFCARFTEASDGRCLLSLSAQTLHGGGDHC